MDGKPLILILNFYHFWYRYEWLLIWLEVQRCAVSFLSNHTYYFSLADDKMGEKNPLRLQEHNLEYHQIGVDGWRFWLGSSQLATHSDNSKHQPHSNVLSSSTLTGKTSFCNEFLLCPIEHQDLEEVFLSGVQACHRGPAACGRQHQLWLLNLWKRKRKGDLDLKLFKCVLLMLLASPKTWKSNDCFKQVLQTNPIGWRSRQPCPKLMPLVELRN